MEQGNCDFSPLRESLQVQLRDVQASIGRAIEGLNDERDCLLCEFEAIRSRILAAETMATTFYLNCYLAGYTDKYAEISLAVRNMARHRHGALIVIERKDPVSLWLTPGTPVEAELTHALLESIFYPGGPLHDGAVMVSRSRLISAANVLPLSERPAGSEKLGTRHRAALGLSERCDALVIVVSEETGKPSFCMEGKLYPLTGI